MLIELGEQKVVGNLDVCKCAKEWIAWSFRGLWSGACGRNKVALNCTPYH